jgi:hypothetical protein
MFFENYNINSIQFFESLCEGIWKITFSNYFILCAQIKIMFIYLGSSQIIPLKFRRPILPGKDHSNPSNYRLISLLSWISKVFERIILKSLNGFISTVNILHDHQFGFRVAHYTSHHLRRVVRHVKAKRSLRVPQSTGMLLLVVEKAFQWHFSGPTYFFIS